MPPRARTRITCPASSSSCSRATPSFASFFSCSPKARRPAASATGRSRRGAATIFGTALHLLIDASVSNETLKSDLESFGAGRVVVSPIDPSLEDVFVRLTEVRAQELEAQGHEVVA